MLCKNPPALVIHLVYNYTAIFFLLLNLKMTIKAWRKTNCFLKKNLKDTSFDSRGWYDNTTCFSFFKQNIFRASANSGEYPHGKKAIQTLNGGALRKKILRNR
jgi:hypothetical protein